MSHLDYGTTITNNPHQLPIWGINTSKNFIGPEPPPQPPQPPPDAYGWGFGGGNMHDSESELEDWWHKFQQRYKYPLYCMVLATEADQSVSSFIEMHRKELAEIVGDKCCLVYFRDSEEAKLLKQFRFNEHADRVMQFIKIIDIQPNKLPCLVFFEQIDSGDFVYVDLGKKSVSELMELFRDLFTFIYKQKEVTLSAVKKYKFSQKVQTTRKNISNNLKQFSIEMVSELMKSLLKLP